MSDLQQSQSMNGSGTMCGDFKNHRDTARANNHCSEHNYPLKMVGGKMVCVYCLSSRSSAAIRLFESFEHASTTTNFECRARAAGLPAGFSGARFENFIAPVASASRISAALQSYTQNFESQKKNRQGFLFTGNPGTGKTHLACAVVNMLLDMGYCPVYASLPRFTSATRSCYGQPGAFDSLMNKMVSADLLILDEIDLHGTSDNDYNILYELINARYELGGRPTIAISNRSVDRLVVDLDERLVSRILAGTKPVQFDWPGQRNAQVGGGSVMQRLAPKGVAA
jgi:DNA replication protein DnaC